MVRSAQSIWEGAGIDGKGTLNTESGVLSGTHYSFAKRFGDEAGTNPEELIAAAHAGCFNMAFAFVLGDNGFTATKLDTTAKVTVVKQDIGFTVTKSVLHLIAEIPGIDETKFQELANAAKAGCPISRLLNAEVSIEATLA